MSWVTGEACLCVLRWQLWRRSERRRNIEKWHVIKEKRKKTEKWHATARMKVQKKMTIDNKLRWKVSGWCDFGLVQTCFQPRSADGSGWLRRPGPERGPTGNALSHLECCDGASLYPGRFPLAVLVPSCASPGVNTSPFTEPHPVQRWLSTTHRVPSYGTDLLTTWPILCHGGCSKTMTHELLSSQDVQNRTVYIV